MAIYLITRNLDLEGVPRWDCYDGHVIIAPSPQRARTMAAEQARDEGSACWLDPKCSSLESIGTPKNGHTKEQIVLSDFNSA